MCEVACLVCMLFSENIDRSNWASCHADRFDLFATQRVNTIQKSMAPKSGQRVVLNLEV